MVVNNPLILTVIRPYFLEGNVALGGFPSVPMTTIIAIELVK